MNRHLAIAACLALATACASSTPAPKGAGMLKGQLHDAEGNKAPVWVYAPGRYTPPDGAKLICAQGSMESTQSISLAQDMSAAEARKNLAASMQVDVKSKERKAQMHAVGRSQYGKAGDQEQAATKAFEEVTAATLSGTQIMDGWVSSEGAYFSLVCLSLDRFKDAVSEMGDLNDKTRQAVMARAEKLWADLREP